jgi:hypothetical protein
MKRLQVHVGVKELPASIRFYLTLLGAEPVVTQPVPAQRAQPAACCAK